MFLSSMVVVSPFFSIKYLFNRKCYLSTSTSSIFPKHFEPEPTEVTFLLLEALLTVGRFGVAGITSRLYLSSSDSPVSLLRHAVPSQSDCDLLILASQPHVECDGNPIQCRFSEFKENVYTNTFCTVSSTVGTAVNVPSWWSFYSLFPPLTACLKILVLELNDEAAEQTVEAKVVDLLQGQEGFRWKVMTSHQILPVVLGPPSGQ